MFQWLAALLLALGASAAEEPPAILLQKGIYTEETEGDLEGALKLYEQIAADAAAHPAVVVQALFRLALAHEKKGGRERAMAVLQEILRRFPAETSLGEQAKKRLAHLEHAPAGVVTTREIPLTATGEMLAVSPDGRYVAARSGGFNVLMAEPATGQTRVLAKGTRENPIGGDVVFSPDSRRVAYIRAGRTITIASVDGSESRDVHGTKERSAGELNVVGWSPDAGRLIVARRFGSEAAKPSLLGEVDVASGAWQEIMAIPAGACALSADGRTVAIREGNREASGRISLHDLETRRASVLIEGDVRALAGWSPGEARVLFTRERAGTVALWSIAVKDGVAAGEPALVSANWADRTVRGIGRDGSITFGEARGGSEVRTIWMNFETGEHVRDYPRPTDRFLGAQTLPVWAKDGQGLLLTMQGGERRFVVAGPAAAEQHDYPLGALAIGRVAWSHAGGFVLIEAVGAGTPHGIHRHDLASGKMETLVGSGEGNGSVWQPELAPDENAFYFIRRRFPQNPDTGKLAPTDRVVRRDLRSAKRRWFTRPPNG